MYNVKTLILLFLLNLMRLQHIMLLKLLSTTQYKVQYNSVDIRISPKHSRFTEESSNCASKKEEKLLGEEDQSDLL